LTSALPQDLHPYRALAGDHVRIIERMHEDEAALMSDLESPRIGGIVIVSLQNDFATQIEDSLHFDVRSRLRHDDDRRDAASARRESNTLRMIAGRGADDASLGGGLRQVRHFVVSAAQL